MRIKKLAAACGLVVSCALSGAASAQTSSNPAALEFTPITPCRAFDTRATTPVSAGATRSFHISGSHDFPEQGGPAHGCGVPDYATAVSLSLISLSQASSGYLTAFAYRTQRPAAVSLYYQKNVTLAGTVITPIAQGNVSIFSSQQSHMAGDVTGYYAPQMYAHVSQYGGIISGSRVVSAVSSGGGHYTVTFDRDLKGCSAVSSADFDGYIANPWIPSDGGSTVTVNTFESYKVYADSFFYLSVHC